jgi:hypothetical protein
MDMSFTMSGTGTYDYDEQIGEADYTSSGAGMPSEQLETIFRNNVLWQRTAGQGRWQEVDYSDLVNTPIGQHDPSEQLDLLRGVSDDVREVGTTQVRGADVHHYAITIDPLRLAQQATVVVEGGLTQAALKATGPIPAEVFVDEDGRVRRLEVAISVSGADLAASPEMSEALGDVLADPRFAEMMRDRRTGMEIAVEYFDFGVPVDVQVPDPAMVDQGPIIPGPR